MKADWVGRQIGRNPFARNTFFVSFRQQAVPCDWCGRPARRFYGSERDSYIPHRNWDSKTFCNLECARSYHGNGFLR